MTFLRNLFSANNTENCNPENCYTEHQRAIALGFLFGTYLTLFCIGLLINRCKRAGYIDLDTEEQQPDDVTIDMVSPSNEVVSRVPYSALR